MSNLIKKEVLYWVIWFILVILWNYGFPEAKPLEDVLVAVLLSIIFILIKKLNTNGAHSLNRTGDLFLTMEMLYQLSYVGLQLY